MKIKRFEKIKGWQEAALTGFTYTEVLIALAVMAALFVPMMQMFSQTLAGSSHTGQAITSLNLAKWQMERLKNLNYNVSQIKELGGAYYPALNEPALELDGRRWRIFTEVEPESMPLKVSVSVFADRGIKDKPLITLTTLITDTSWTFRSTQ